MELEESVCVCVTERFMEWKKSRSDYPQTLSSPYNPISHPCQLILEGNESNIFPNTCQMLGIMIQLKHTVTHPKALSNMQKNGGAKGLK